jgi:hypothetical protein
VRFWSSAGRAFNQQHGGEDVVRVGTSGGDGQPIEVTEYIVTSDRVETVHVLHRDESAQAPWPDGTEGPDEIETGR